MEIENKLQFSVVHNYIRALTRPKVVRVLAAVEKKDGRVFELSSIVACPSVLVTRNVNGALSVNKIWLVNGED